MENKRIRRRSGLRIVEYALHLDSEVEREAQEALKEYLTLKGGDKSEME